MISAANEACLARGGSRGGVRPVGGATQGEDSAERDKKRATQFERRVQIGAVKWQTVHISFQMVERGGTNNGERDEAHHPQQRESELMQAMSREVQLSKHEDRRGCGKHGNEDRLNGFSLLEEARISGENASDLCQKYL